MENHPCLQVNQLFLWAIFNSKLLICQRATCKHVFRRMWGTKPNQSWDSMWDNRMIRTSSTAHGGGGSFKNMKPIGELGCCESGMAERSHWWTERCLRSPLFLSLSLTIYLPTYLSSMYLSIYLSMYLSLSLFHLITYLSIYLSFYLSIYLSICLAVYLSVCLSICLSV